jgi:hypothetical protein
VFGFYLFPVSSGEVLTSVQSARFIEAGIEMEYRKFQVSGNNIRTKENFYEEISSFVLLMTLLA